MRNLNVLLNEEITKIFKLNNPLQFQDELYRYEDLHDKMVRTNTNLKNQFISQELFRNATQNARANLSPAILLNLGATGSLDQLNANFRTSTGNQIENLVA